MLNQLVILLVNLSIVHYVCLLAFEARHEKYLTLMHVQRRLELACAAAVSEQSSLSVSIN